MGSYEMYGFGFNVEKAFERLQVEITFPTLSIKSIDENGLLVVQFSDEFFEVKDLTLLTSTRALSGSESQAALAINAVALDWQEEDKVTMDWTVLSYSTTQMKIQMNFE